MGTNDAEYPTASYEYGHKIDRAERSAETYRIGGLMDQIDSEAILAALFAELGSPPDHARRCAAAALARLASAEPPILTCRIYEADNDPDPRILTALNAYTTAVLEAVAETETPNGWTLTVAADSDAVLGNDAGEWVGLSRRGKGENIRWIWSRGSIGHDDRQDYAWPTLAEAIAELIAEAPDA